MAPLPTHRTFLAALLAVLLAIVGITAAIAADPPPPRIAFVANGRVPADALAAGPTAGQLGAPIFTTEQHLLPGATADALRSYAPELVIVLGGPVAIANDVVNAVAAATGLAMVPSTPPPPTGVVRAAGADRFLTAAAIAELLGDYGPAYLGADLQAVDADTVDGIDSGQLQIPGALPSGRTLRGIYDVSHDGGEPGSLGYFTSAVSFPVPLPDAPTTHLVQDGATAPTACPGTPDQPEAEPGHLCLYETTGNGYVDVYALDPLTSNTQAASRYGFAVVVKTASAGSAAFSRGTWAVTAE